MFQIPHQLKMVGGGGETTLKQRVEDIQPAFTLQIGSFRFCLFQRFPGHLRRPAHAMPCAVDKRLAGVVPGGVHHAQRAMLVTVAHQIGDVFGVEIITRKYRTPHAHARRHHKLKSLFLKGFYHTHITVQRRIRPHNHQHVFGQLGRNGGIFRGNIAPHHHPLAEGFQHIIHPTDVVGIHLRSAVLGHIVAGLAAAQRLCLITIDIEKRRAVRLRNRFQFIFQKVLRLFRVPIRLGVRHLLIIGNAQRLLRVRQTLLVAKELDMILGGKLLQLPDLRSGKPVRWGDVIVVFQFENMLGIEIEEVHLVFGHGGNHPFQKRHVHNRPAADIVHPSAVFQFGIIDNPHAWYHNLAVFLGEMS